MVSSTLTLVRLIVNMPHSMTSPGALRGAVMTLAEADDGAPGVAPGPGPSEGAAGGGPEGAAGGGSGAPGSPGGVG